MTKRVFFVALLVLVLAAAAIFAGWRHLDATTPAPDAVASGGASPEIVLPGAPTDAGFEPGTLSGLVQDESLAPVANVRVRLLPGLAEEERCPVCKRALSECDDPATLRAVLQRLRTGQVPPIHPLAETRTDAAGRFTFPSFPSLPWNATIVADLEGREDSVTPRVLPIKLTLGSAEVRPFTVTDQLELPSPIANARLTTWSKNTGEVAQYLSDEQGQFALPPLDDDVWLGVDADGYLPQRTRLILKSVALFKPRTLLVHTVRLSKPVDADVWLEDCGHPQHARAVEGLTRFEGIPGGEPCELRAVFEGFSAGPRDAPLASAVNDVTLELLPTATLHVTVRAPASSPERTLRATLLGTTSSIAPASRDGARFTFTAPVGDYQLQAGGPGLRGSSQKLDLPPGETSLEVTLEALPHAHGVVLDASGQPAPRTEVSIVGDVSNRTSRATSDAQGHFTLELFGAGPWLVHAEHDALGEVDAPVSAQGDELVLTLVAGGGLEVTVSDADGSPLPADCDLAPRANPELSRWVPETGVLGSVPAGEWTVEKVLEGHVPMRKPVTIVKGQVTRVHLALDRGVSISGQVVDHRGKPVAEATVSVVDDDDNVVATDAQGRFELRGLARGPVMLEADSDLTNPVHTQVTAPAKGVVLRFEAPSMLTGRVVDGAHHPLPKFEVDGEEVTHPDGRFSVPLLGDEVSFSAEGYQEKVLTSQRAGDVGDVVLVPLPSIDGEVVDAQGTPVAHALVLDADEGASTITNSAGHFHLQLNISETRELVATKGTLSGRAPVGTQPMRITLAEGQRVRGFVRDGQGQPVAGATVVAKFDVRPSVKATSDSTGRFEMRLEAGPWMFSLSGSRRSKVMVVEGDATEVVLSTNGEGPCGFVAQTSQPILAAWLLPAPLRAGVDPLELVNSTQGAVLLETNPLEGTLVSADRLACGQQVLVLVSALGKTSTHPITLTGPAEHVTLRVP